MREAPETKTITRTVRLAGFEIEEHKHVSLRLLREGRRVYFQAWPLRHTST
jgi:hypothetical protein